MAENVETLTCPQGHEVEVHYETKQKAKHWQCPECVADPAIENDDTLVPFKGGK